MINYIVIINNCDVFRENKNDFLMLEIFMKCENYKFSEKSCKIF